MKNWGNQIHLAVPAPQPIEHERDGGRFHADLPPLAGLLLVQPGRDADLATHFRDDPQMVRMLDCGMWDVLCADDR